ncbi:MAG: TnpV protein [Eubacteriales bacterium]|nr:TnpV protein [Eubacteriales bacterium]
MNVITYTEVNGYRIPDLTLPEEPEAELGRYALMRRHYLMNHRKGLFSRLLMNGGLNPHLTEIEQTAMERLERQTAQMAQSEGVTEQMKAATPMRWIQRMTSIRNRVEETILNDLIYS